MKFSLGAKSLRRAFYIASSMVMLGSAGGAMAQGVVDAARAALPAKIRDAGVLNVATSLQWAPFGYRSDSGEVVGIDIKLVNLIAAKLGLEAKFDDIKFPAIVPGVQTGRYDIGVNQMGITAERKKAVDMIPYFNASWGLLVPKGRSSVNINDLCGKSLALTQGSAQTAILQALSDDCVAGGKPKIEMVVYPNSSDTFLAVSNGRGDGFMTSRAAGLYTAQKNPKLEVAPGHLDGHVSIAGIVVGKGNNELRQAILLALESAIDDGSYKATLDEFGVADGGLTIDQIKAGY